jgi:hypothetical protein
VAEFLRAHMAELETSRRDAVERALLSAETRDGGKSQVVTALVDDPALAPTAVVARAAPASPRAVEAKTQAIKKKGTGAKRKRPRVDAIEPLSEDSKVTPTATLTPSGVTAPKSRSVMPWLLGLAAIAAGAWFVWPGGDRLRVMIGADAPPEPAAPAESAAASAATAPTASAPVAPATAAATATVAVTASAATAPPSASAIEPPRPPGTGRFPRPPAPPPATPTPTPPPAPAEPPEAPNPYE